MLSLFKFQPKKYEKNALWIQIGFLAFGGLILIQLIRLQIFQGPWLKEKAIQNRQPSRAYSFRGEITDRNGIRLATDVTLYDIYAHPEYYGDKTPRQIAQILAPILNKPEQELYNKLNDIQASTITLIKNIDRTTYIKIKKFKIRGLDIVKKNDRVYPQGILASHILGYVNADAKMFGGVEQTASDNLQKLPNIKPVEYDGNGDVIYDFDTDPSYTALPLKGKKLSLTIDSSIQHISETELLKCIKKFHAQRGTVIVMNPKNGELLGFAVYPSYDPNKLNKTNSLAMKNWVLSDVYPPGSTFKIITVASALQSGAITKNFTINDTGKVKLQGWTIENYDFRRKGAPGIIDLVYLFVHSSNIGSLRVALTMTANEFYTMLKLFGIGNKTGIDLPGESAGIIHKPDTWNTITQANMGFGYSIATTPIQIASAVAAIANGGIWTTPHVIKYTEKEAAKRIKTRKVLSPKVAKDLTTILAESIKKSEAKTGKIPNFYVAGKTGTSRKPNANGTGYLDNQVFTSFVGYFPVKDPQVLIMVMIDDPRGAEMWGSTVAGPVFNAVATEVARILNLEPDAPGMYVKKQKEEN